jgi:cation diffusion facilitator CzcD-associated flavoprotein CzcO
MSERYDAVVVGGGPAGLAAAAELGRTGARVVVLDAGDRPGASWAAHYDTLRLNTVSWTSHLPGLRFPRADGAYPGRDRVVAYLERYVTHHRLDVRWSTRVESVLRDGDTWRVHAPELTVSARPVVIATGSCARPRVPSWPGREEFAGRVLHSSEYRSPKEFTGRRAGLAVGPDRTAGGAASGGRPAHRAARHRHPQTAGLRR